MNPFLHRKPVKPPIFAGRLSELKELKRLILEDDSSVSVSGYNRIGKSSLILTLFQNFEEEDCGVFPVHINESQFRDYMTGDFFNIICHEICCAIWIKIFKLNFSDLLDETLLHARGSSIENKHKTLLKKIFRIVTSKSFSSKGNKTSDISAKFGVGASMKEINDLSLTRKPLMSSEFLMLVDELMSILEEYNKSKILIVCDQLNHGAPDANYEIISQYFEALSSKRVLFMVSALGADSYSSEGTQQRNEDMLKSFGGWVELGGFDSSSDVSDYVLNSLNFSNPSNITFDTQCFVSGHELCEGIPWFVSQLFQLSYQKAIHNNKSTIIADDIERYGVAFTKAISEYHQHNSRIPPYELERIIASHVVNK